MKQRTEEWFRARLGKITASNIHRLMKSPSTKTYISYQREILGQILAPQIPDVTSVEGLNATMRWGIEHEDAARAEYEELRGVTIEECGFILHPKYSLSGASPDGLVGDNGLIEIKCPTTAVHIRNWISDNLLEEYLYQVQFQLACTQRKWCDFVSYDPRMKDPYLRICIKRIERDEEIIKKIEERVDTCIKEINLMLACVQHAVFLQRGLPKDASKIVKYGEWDFDEKGFW